jgi:NitT/TauT family transport system substrate-binding protein
MRLVHTHRTPALAAVGLTALLLTTACATSNALTTPAAPRLEKTNLVVDAVPGEGAAGLFIAEEDGLFAKAGLHVKIVPVESSSTSTVLPNMEAGKVDVASGQYTSYILPDAFGAAKVRILAAGYSLGPNVQVIMVRSHNDATSVTGLKDKTIALNATNSVTSDLLFNLLSTYGVLPRQVRLVVMPFPAMPAALAAGKIDAIYEIEPYVTEAEQQFGEEELADIDSGANENFPVNGYGVLASWAAKYPHTAAAFARVIKQANSLAATNISVLQHVLSTALHLSPQVTDVMANGSFPTDADPVQLQRVADLMLKYGQIRRAFQVKSIIGMSGSGRT